MKRVKYNPKTAFGNIKLVEQLKKEAIELAVKRAIKGCGKCEDGWLIIRDTCPTCDGTGEADEVISEDACLCWKKYWDELRNQSIKEVENATS